MLTAILVLAIFGVTVLLWSNIRGAAEVATHYGRRACQDSGVQWLDHTVMLERLSFKRAPDGWVRALRRYRFDFSTDGHDRHRGHMELLGSDLQWLRMPPPPPSAPEPPSVPEWQLRMQLAPPPRPPDGGAAT